MAIGSNSSKYFVEAVVTRQNLPISIILGFEDTPKQKPHPNIYLACAQGMRIPKEQWVGLPVFEDSFHGLEAAKRAQMLPIGVATLHPKALLLEKGAQAVVDHLGQVNLVLD
jgi:beta-phosphoglucomutase-like phosphatase (HAD superfamily)